MSEDVFFFVFVSAKRRGRSWAFAREANIYRLLRK